MSNSNLNFDKRWLILIIPLLLVLVIAIFIYAKAEPFVRTKIHQALSENGLRGSFDGPDIDLFSGSLSLSNIHIQPEESDSSTLSITKASVSGASIWKYIFNDSIAIETIRIDSPRLKLQHNFKIKKDSTSGKKKKLRAGIDSVKINNAEISYIMQKGGLKAYNLNVTLSNVIKLPDSAAQPGNVVIQLDSGNFMTPDSLYTLRVQNLTYDQQISTLQFISGIHSIHAKNDFGARVGHETDWINVDSLRIRMEGLHLQQSLRQKNMRASLIHLEGPEIEVYRDKRQPFPQKPDTKLPYQTLQELTIDIAIDSISLTNGNASYTERVENTNQPGTVTFNDLEIGISNITNMKSVMEKEGRLARMQATAKVMNASTLNAYWTFPLDSAAGPHTAFGKMDAMDLTEYNPMMKYAAYSEIESGQQRSLEYNFSYDPSASNGTMEFVYTDLKIKTLGDFPSEDQGLGSELKSALANAIVQNKNLPGNSFRTGDISFQRDPKKSLLSYWWKSLLSGFKSSVGLKPKAK